MYHTGIHPIVHNRRKVLDMVFLYFYFYGCALVSTLSVEQKKKKNKPDPQKYNRPHLVSEEYNNIYNNGFLEF